MIVVNIEKSGPHYCGFRAFGHAYFDKHGKDIVCASISVLTQTCLIALDEVAHADPTFFIDEETGDLEVHCDLATEANQQLRIDTLIESMALGIRAISDMYPHYVSLEEREVQLNDH